MNVIAVVLMYPFNMHIMLEILVCNVTQILLLMFPETMSIDERVCLGDIYFKIIRVNPDQIKETTVLFYF